MNFHYKDEKVYNIKRLFNNKTFQDIKVKIQRCILCHHLKSRITSIHKNYYNFKIWL